MGNNYYYPLNVDGHADLVKMVGQFPIMIGNEKDHLATRVANKLNLTGPAVSVHTACSTALTAVDNAFFSLITRQCDMALAGGISLQTPQYSGQLYEDGGVFAIDGHCRPFDADTTGTMFSDSAGIIVMKRLDDALRDNDTIYAVIKSTALNNDGSEKISYLAPSINGQKQVIAMALARAGIDAGSISYIEAHGTGTPIGDPIEVEALTQIYRRYTDKNQFCGIGSIKSNLGHPTIAAGVTGVIKVALSLKNEKIPATIHYKNPNPKIDFEHSPFYVVDKLTAWPKGEEKRRGAVSAFGFGGTNGHTILEEAPDTKESDPSRSTQLIVLSAKNKDALDMMTKNLADYLEINNDTNIADVAFTLQNGRVSFNHRRFIVCKNNDDAITNLRTLNPQFSSTRLVETKSPEIVFLFPGQGSQYLNMGRDLYDSEPCFKEVVDYCSELLNTHIGCDLRDILYPTTDDIEQATETLKNTYYQQPAIFVIEYALAKLWASWGVTPDIMVGHSIGEFVCATLSGVFKLEDTLGLIAARGRLMSSLPTGSMLSVRLPAEVIEQRLMSGLSLATSNGPSLCVVAGPDDIIEEFQKELEKEDIACTLLHTSHAFHSEMMEPAVAPFTELVSKVERTSPVIPFISTLTNKWVTQNEITDPAYWGKHLRSPVRFAEAIGKIWEEPERILLEVGPRAVTSTLARQQAKDLKKQIAIASLSDNADNNMEQFSMLKALGSLWLAGVDINREKFWANEKRRRITLPTYPFARKRVWLDPVAGLNKFDKSNTQPVETELSAEVLDVIQHTSGTVEYKQKTAKDQLIEILEEISGIEFGEDLDVTRTFAEMGLDSLFLTQIAFKLKSDFNLEVSFRQLTNDYSTIERLSQYIQEEISELTDKSSDNSIVEESSDSELSLTHDSDVNSVQSTSFQKEIFELIQQDGDSASCSFNESITITLKGNEFNQEKMREALHELVKRHEALRYTFSHDGKYLIPHKNVNINISVEDISLISDKLINEKITDILKQDFCKPFNLESGPLFRSTIIKVDENIHKVIITSHLAVCDGWSLDVLVRDLGIIYSSSVMDMDAKLNLDIADKFSDYLLGTTTFEKTDAYKQMRSFWKKKLATPISCLDYPIKQDLPAQRSYNGSRCDLSIDKPTVRALKSLSSRIGCSYFTILLAGYKLLLLGLTQQKRLVVGMPVAGQAIVNKKFLVGNCLNYIPLVSEVSPQQSVEEFIGTLKSTILDAIENGKYSFNEITDQPLKSVHPARVPFIQTCLNMSPKMEGNQLSYANLEVEYDVNPRYFESFEIFINAVTEKDDVLLFEFQYNSNLFSENTIRTWQTILHDILRDLDNRSDFEISNFLNKYFFENKREHTQKNSTLNENSSSDLQQPGDASFYFSEASDLYGICNIPKTKQLNTGVIFCYPLAQEYILSHWSFRLLAKSLLAEGFPVLKFDYFGTGDSLGDTNDWNLDRWILDIQAAANELKLRSGVENISVVTLRFGSILAASAIEKGLKVDRLILWEPVFSGAEYLSGLKNMQNDFLKSVKNNYPYPDDKDLEVHPDEILGFIFEKNLQKDIVSSQLRNFSFTNCKNVDFVCTNNLNKYNNLIAASKTKMNNVKLHKTNDSTSWDDHTQFDIAILPSNTIVKITALLKGLNDE